MKLQALSASSLEAALGAPLRMLGTGLTIAAPRGAEHLHEGERHLQAKIRVLDVLRSYVRRRQRRTVRWSRLEQRELAERDLAAVAGVGGVHQLESDDWRLHPGR